MLRAWFEHANSGRELLGLGLKWTILIFLVSYCYGQNSLIKVN